MRKIAGLSVLFSALVLAANLFAWSAEKDAELEKLAGTYAFVSMESNGPAIPEKVLAKMKTMRMVIQGNTLSMSGEGLDKKSQTISITATRTPKEIDITREGNDPKGKKQVVLGIYSLEGKTLKICTDNSGTKRPAEFAPKKCPSAVTLVVLERQ